MEICVTLELIKLDGTQEHGRKELCAETHTALSRLKPVMMPLKWKMALFDSNAIIRAMAKVGLIVRTDDDFVRFIQFSTLKLDSLQVMMCFMISGLRELGF